MGNKNSLGIKRSKEFKQKLSKSRKGKTWEEIYGVKYANKRRKQQRAYMLGDKNIAKRSDVRKKISKSNKNKHRTKEQRRVYSETTKLGMKLSGASKKISKALKNKRLTQDHINNIRKGFINRIKKRKGKFLCNIGDNETLLLNKQEKIDHCKIDRKFVVIGFKPDGYCYETNTVYEVNELAHYGSKERIKGDLKRQKLIEKELGCKFIIIEDKSH